MGRKSISLVNKIQKRHVAAAVNFAIEYLPQADEPTLEKFLALVNISGSFGSISREQLHQKMGLLIKLMPDVCCYSLLVLIDLLGVTAYEDVKGSCWVNKMQVDPRLS